MERNLLQTLATNTTVAVLRQPGSNQEDEALKESYKRYVDIMEVRLGVLDLLWGDSAILKAKQQEANPPVPDFSELRWRGIRKRDGGNRVDSSTSH